MVKPPLLLHVTDVKIRIISDEFLLYAISVYSMFPPIFRDLLDISMKQLHVVSVRLISYLSVLAPIQVYYVASFTV